MDLNRLRPMLNNGFYYGTDGMFHRETTDRFPVDEQTMWVGNGSSMPKCEFCFDIFYQIFRFVPSCAMNCFKVVVTPRTLDELFDLYKFQQKFYTNAKCGVDARMSSEGMYKGFFYNDSLGNGLKCYKDVRKAFNPDIHVILKRGCSEMEFEFGDSSKWQISEDNLQLEKDVLETYKPDNRIVEQPKDLKKWIMRKWIFWARSIGDQTYKHYTKNPLYPVYHYYHEEIEK